MATPLTGPGPASGALKRGCMAVLGSGRRRPDEYCLYTTREWGEEQALRYLDDPEACCQQVADHPGLGRACDEIRPGLHRIEHGQHVVFYRRQKEGILISRILHQRMLPGRQFGDKD